MIKAKDITFKFGVRKNMVLDAMEKGIKPVARQYETTVKTVKKWLARYKAKGVGGLEECSRAPKHIPHKTSQEIANRVIAKKKQLKGFGVKRMIKEFELGCGKDAAIRILREEELICKRKTKRQRRNDLREIKAKWRVGEVCCIDTKDLTDIPAYWSQMNVLDLPQWQYTFREVRSGLQFLGFAKQRSLQHSVVFAESITAWLSEHGLNLSGSRWQTDGGGEFIGSWNSNSKSDFIKVLEKHSIKHFQIPKTTYNADVETVHNLIEFEFYDIERFCSKRDFLLKASTYQRWFNTLRKNSHKYDQSPLDILKTEGISNIITTLPALDLDNLVERKIHNLIKSSSPSGGYHVPRHTHLKKLRNG